MIGEQLAMRIKAVLFDLGGTLVDTPSDFDYENLLVPLHQSLVKNGVVVPFDEYRKVHVGIRDRIWSEDSLKEVAFASIICEALGRLGYSFQFTDKLISYAVFCLKKEAKQHPAERRRVVTSGDW